HERVGPAARCLAALPGVEAAAAPDEHAIAVGEHVLGNGPVARRPRGLVAEEIGHDGLRLDHVESLQVRLAPGPLRRLPEEAAARRRIVARAAARAAGGAAPATPEPVGSRTRGGVPRGPRTGVAATRGARGAAGGEARAIVNLMRNADDRPPRPGLARSVPQC